jgi:DNA-binding YbaB/EbfC family protein
MKNLGNLMKQAQEMQSKMGELQERLAEVELTGNAGGDMVRVTVNGRNEVRAVKIDPALAKPEDVEMLEDLLVAAFADARVKVEARMREEMSKLTGGIDLPPGFNLPI